MNRYSIAVMTVTLLVLNSCSDSFLDITPKGQNLESTFYSTPEEAFSGLVAVYDVVGWQGGNLTTKAGATMAASDDHKGGGEGSGDKTFTSWDDFTLTPAQGPQADLWKKGFSGIFRANVLLQKIPGVPMSDALKARYTAEAKFLRAYFNFDLVRFFRYIPLLTAPVSPDAMYDVVQATPEAVYAQIEQDLTEALPDLPKTVDITKEGGRATQGAAHALLGKVYLQQEKFALAAEQFADVNGTPGGTNQYGYRLVTNFGDLWKSTNNMKYNTESIFEIGFSNKSAGDWSCVACTEGNILNIMTGPRGYNPISSDAPDFVSGWSYFPVTQSLHDFMHGDPRYLYTIADLDSLKDNGIATYTAGGQNTGYFINKFAGRKSNSPVGLPGAQELNYPQNMYEIRLADTYLLEAEALVRSGESGGAGTRAYDLLNAVRARVGLDPVDATFDNIKRERRMELAGEGHRWFDLVRWGDAATVLAGDGFQAGKHEYLPIPLNELNNTRLQQTKAWGGTL